MHVTWTVLLLSVLAYCIAALILPLCFMPLIIFYNSLAKRPATSINHPIFVGIYIISGLLLFYLTSYIWENLGYKLSWGFPVTVGALHYWASRARGANLAKSSTSSRNRGGCHYLPPYISILNLHQLHRDQAYSVRVDCQYCPVASNAALHLFTEFYLHEYQ